MLERLFMKGVCIALAVASIYALTTGIAVLFPLFILGVSVIGFIAE